MSQSRASPSSFDAQFAAARRGLPGAGVGWLDAARREALARFDRNGLPTRKVEAWKFTDLRRLAAVEFDHAPSVARRPLTRADLAPYRLLAGERRLVVFVNGRFRRDLSEIEGRPGLRVTEFAAADDAALQALAVPPLAGLEPRARALADLNTAFMRDGAVIDIAAGAVLEPIQLLFVVSEDGVSEGGVSEDEAARGERPVFHLRNLVRLGQGASATVVETYAGPDSRRYWTNAVTRIELADRAALQHCKLQLEGAGAVHVGATAVRVARQAAYRLFAGSLGAELARTEIDIDLAAPEATAELAGISLGRAHQHLDTTARVRHNELRGRSRQEFRHVVDDHAHAVFQGSVHVAVGAQKTDAQQQSRSLLLSPTAASDTKPELDILADDVVCSHGAATGDLDPDQLFYLQARGIDAREARALLTRAFIGHLVDGIEGEAVRAHVGSRVDAWLQEMGLQEMRP